MSERKKKKRAKGKARPRRQTPARDPGMVFRVMEREKAALERHLEGQEFESKEEVEAFLASLLSQSEGWVPRLEPTTPLDKAQDLIYEAWELDDPLVRICFALKALHICRDCADAYCLLAEEAALDQEQARDLYAEAVGAGERALGPQFFQEHVGDFWGIVRSRPYMRARSGLAQVLWALGRRDEAITHFYDMLRLNPNDNQGVRYLLASWLLEMGRDDELVALFERYPEDDGVDFVYSRALFEFRRSGDSEQAREALAQAVERNKYVPLYLLERKRLPEQMPEAYATGTHEEAQCYTENGLGAWRASPGARDWLERFLQTHYRHKPASA